MSEREGKLAVEGEVDEWRCYLFALAPLAVGVSLNLSFPLPSVGLRDPRHVPVWRELASV